MKGNRINDALANFMAHEKASDYENGTDDPEGFEEFSRNAATVLASFAAMSAAIFAIAF